MSQNRFISLRVGMATAFALTVVVTAGLIGVSTFFAARSFIRDSIRHRLENIATLAATRIQAETHSRIRTIADQNSADYAAIKRTLVEIKSVSPDIRFVYTYRIDDAGKVMFVVDAENADSPDLSQVGDVYTEATPLMRSIYQPSARATAEDKFTADKWGLWLSCFVPVLDSAGRVECAIGIDISARAVQDYEYGFLVTIGGFSAVIGVVVLLASIWYARRISRPLLSLAHELGRVQRLDLDHRVEIDSYVREVVVMRDAVRSLQSGLRSFRKYVPADLVSELMSLGQEARLSAEKREVTLFFSDIADFTTLSEKSTPEHLVEQLSVYFDGMTRSIIEGHGTVDKYIGDAIMAFWGAPRPAPDHAELACRAALRCRDHSRRVAVERARAGLPPMLTRIGLGTGPAIIGNIGYDARLNYTAMGDTVNLASRIEGLNKVYGTEILINETTWRHVNQAFATRLVDVVAVKGKTIPVRIYELLGERGAVDPVLTRFAAAYEQALDLYFARRFAEAASAFAVLVQENPENRAASVLEERCQRFQSEPPPANWQGEHVLDHK